MGGAKDRVGIVDSCEARLVRGVVEARYPCPLCQTETVKHALGGRICTAEGCRHVFRAQAP